MSSSLPIFRFLVASTIAGVMGVTGMLVSPQKNSDGANIRIVSSQTSLSVNDTFTVTIVAEAFTPVNVFKGLIKFNPNILKITSIDYNTSLIDLWAEEPWYSNGDGTLNFTGGTTKPGGFIGRDILLTITFNAIAAGDTALIIQEVRILKHDGLGNDATVEKPIDYLFSINEKPRPEIAATKSNLKGPVMNVFPVGVSTDLNQDGKQSLADVSIFMKHLATGNLKSDFNQDGKVNLSDLSILMQ